MCRPSRRELSSRELEIVQLCSGGKPYKAIAHVLGLSVQTVKIRARVIVLALRARNMTHACAMLARLEMEGR